MTGSRTNEKAFGKEVNQMQELIGKLKKAGSSVKLKNLFGWRGSFNDRR